jgi:hypothetical protein
VIVLMLPSTREPKQKLLSLSQASLVRSPLETPLRRLALATWDNDTVVGLIKTSEEESMVVGPTSGANIKINQNHMLGDDFRRELQKECDLQGTRTLNLRLILSVRRATLYH